MKYEKHKNYQKFVNEILDDVIMESDKVSTYQFFKETGLFKIYTKKCIINFYPKSDKVLFSNKKNWELDGLNKILKHIA